MHHLLKQNLYFIKCFDFTFHFAEKMKFSSKRIFPYKNGREDFELPVFSFKTIAKATNNFSENNKLGEGGFGPVYMVIIHISTSHMHNYIVY